MLNPSATSVSASRPAVSSGAVQAATMSFAASSATETPQTAQAGDIITLQEHKTANGNWLNTHPYSAKSDWPTLAALHAQQATPLSWSDKLMLTLASTQAPNVISTQKSQALQLFQLDATNDQPKESPAALTHALPQAALVAFDPDRSWIVRALLRGKQPNLEQASVLLYPATKPESEEGLKHLLKGSLKALAAQGKSSIYVVLPKAQAPVFEALGFTLLKDSLNPGETSVLAGRNALDTLLVNHFESDTHQVMQRQLPTQSPTAQSATVLG